MNRLKAITVAGSMLLLMGCEPQVADVPTALPSPISTRTSTTTPTETPRPTSTVTRTPYPPTPEFQTSPNIFDSPIADDLLFSGDDSCKLPCWYGLRIGESRVGEIQRVIKEAIGLSEGYVLLMGRDSIYNSDYVEFYWQNGSSSDIEMPYVLPYVSVVAFFDVRSDNLSRLSITTTEPFFLNRVTPQYVLREMGVPRTIWVNFSLTEVVEIASLTVDFLYPDREQWTFISWRIRIPVHLQQNGNKPRTATWCLTAGEGQDEQDFLLRVPPDFDPETRVNYGTSLQTIFDISPAELYDRAIQEENTCLTHEF